MNIYFSNLHVNHCQIVLIIAKEVNQTRNNVVCVVVRLVFVFCCALTTGRCNAFQHIFVNVISCDYVFFDSLQNL